MKTLAVFAAGLGLCLLATPASAFEGEPRELRPLVAIAPLRPASALVTMPLVLAPMPLAQTIATTSTTATVTVNDADERKKLESRRRVALRPYHVGFGVATLASMLVTNALGGIRIENTVGSSSRCKTDENPVFGRDFGCGDGLLYTHLGSAILTTALYATSLTLATIMPDPYHSAEGDGWSAKRLRIHKTLTIVHLIGMIALPVLGVATTQSSNEGTREALAITHAATAWTTFAAMAGSAAVMVF